MTKYSYADYLTWPEDNSVELIEGIAYAMTPAPASIHQKIVVGGPVPNTNLSTYCLAFEN